LPAWESSQKESTESEIQASQRPQIRASVSYFQGRSQALIQLPEKLVAGSAKKFVLYAKNHRQLLDCLVLKKPLTSAPARRNFPIRRNHNILCVAAAGKPKPWVCPVRGIGVQPGVAWTFGGGANGEN